MHINNSVPTNSQGACFSGESTRIKICYWSSRDESFGGGLADWLLTLVSLEDIEGQTEILGTDGS